MPPLPPTPALHNFTPALLTPLPSAALHQLRGQRATRWHGLRALRRGATPQSPILKPTPLLPSHSLNSHAHGGCTSRSVSLHLPTHCRSVHSPGPSSMHFGLVRLSSNGHLQSPPSVTSPSHATLTLQWGRGGFHLREARWDEADGRLSTPLSSPPAARGAPLGPPGFKAPPPPPLAP